MPWWSWVLIWSALAIALLTMLVLFGVALFRKLMTLADALGDLGEQVSAASAGLDGGHPRDTGESTPTAPARSAVPAVFQNRDQLSLGVAARRFERMHRRQLRRDRAIDRGKLLRTAPVIPKDSSDA